MTDANGTTVLTSYIGILSSLTLLHRNVTGFIQLVVNTTVSSLKILSDVGHVVIESYTKSERKEVSPSLDFELS